MRRIHGARLQLARLRSQRSPVIALLALASAALIATCSSNAKPGSARRGSGRRLRDRCQGRRRGRWKRSRHRPPRERLLGPAALDPSACACRLRRCAARAPRGGRRRHARRRRGHGRATVESFLRKDGRLRPRAHGAVHRLRSQHPERAPQGARAGRIPVRAVPRALRRRRRGLRGRSVGRADLRLVEHRRHLRRHHRGGDAPAGRDQLHPQGAGIRSDADAHLCSGTTTSRPTSARPPAPTATGASGPRS